MTGSSPLGMQPQAGDIGQVSSGALLNPGTVRDVVQVPRNGYVIDFIYFPTPETGVRGQRFELFMDAPELPDPVFVRFEVR